MSFIDKEHIQLNFSLEIIVFWLVMTDLKSHTFHTEIN